MTGFRKLRRNKIRKMFLNDIYNKNMCYTSSETMPFYRQKPISKNT